MTIEAPVRTALNQEIEEIVANIWDTQPYPQESPYGRDEQGRRRVVITGMGCLTCLGLSLDETWAGLVAGRSGLGHPTRLDVSNSAVKVVGEVHGFDPQNYMDFRSAKRMARFSQFAVVAAQMALADADWSIPAEEAFRTGVVMGVGMGSLLDVEEAFDRLQAGKRLSPFAFPIILPNMAGYNVSLTTGARGFNACVSTACASGTQALGDAAAVIRRGGADAMLAGGTSADICQFALAGFSVMQALSTWSEEPLSKASRPFDKNRDGFVAAEGAGVMVLESLDHALARGARIHAEVLGFGNTSDAYHLTAPDPEAVAPAMAMQIAIADAGLSPADIGYINAHGTSTPLNDPMETLAIKRVFGERAYQVPISSNKSMIGHLISAAGAVEAIAMAQTLRTGIIPPTINLEEPDPACDLDYVPNQARRVPVEFALSNSFGFGGQNACLVLGRYES
ncbi:MAG: beta-ketoacyl-ACP synthase II [Chloroflexi bacterium]|nr:beta-ketoacyl-ACP synthase II [Chloroflexota bacterium]MBU1751352.1 beta-ketoacyl-ACP synthase II [Chloroflexota bacterium]